MDTTVRIVAAERVAEGVLIEFSDGQVALFPADLLWALVPGYNVNALIESAEESGEDDTPPPPPEEAA